MSSSQFLKFDQLPDEYDYSICEMCKSNETNLLRDSVSRMDFLCCSKCKHSKTVRNPFYKAVKVVGYPNNCGYELVSLSV